MSALFYTSYGALWLLVVVLFLLVVGLIRTTFELRQQLALGGQDRRAPHFRAPDLTGGVVENRDFAGRPYALIFVTPTCPMCREAVTNLGPVRKRAGDTIVVLCNGERAAAERLAEVIAPDVRFALDEGGEVGKAFGVSSAPVTVVVDHEGWIRTIGSILENEPLADVEPALIVVGSQKEA